MTKVYNYAIVSYGHDGEEERYCLADLRGVDALNQRIQELIMQQTDFGIGFGKDSAVAGGYPQWEVVVNDSYILGCLDESHALEQLEYTRNVLGYPKAYINKHYPDHDERYQEPLTSR